VLDHLQNVRRERLIAETFQRSMLPAELPGGALELVAHYLPQAEGSHVGGDWYDALTFEDGCVALCIGDVAGKGLAAAVTMGQVRSAMSALALTHRQPRDLLERVDVFVSRLDTMVTVLYLLVDPAAGTITYARAGHLAPLRRAADGSVDVLEGALSPPLVGAGAERTQAVTHLEPGSQLVLYTDGLIERRDEHLNASLDALVARCAAARVAPAQLGRFLLDRAEQDTPVLRDDVAILTAHLPRDAVPGLVHDVATRLVDVVVPPAPLPWTQGPPPRTVGACAASGSSSSSSRA
jgi:serine phosphatase RsbU (regulator of sigma subunit)